MPILRTYNKDFFKTWSPQMAYVLGFFAADGCMSTHKNGGKFIEFCSTDKELISNVKTVINSTHKIGIRNDATSHKMVYRLQIGSKIWFQDLTTLGFCSNKSLVVRMPIVPKLYISDFIRGYFDGDGCISWGLYERKNRKDRLKLITTRFTSGSLGFLKDLWGQLRPFLKGGYLYSKQNKSGFELVFAAKDSLALFEIMYHNVSSGNFLKRKFEKFREAFAGVA